MNELFITLVLYIVLGAIGSGGRILLQRARDKEWPVAMEGAAVHLSLGALGGYVTFELMRLGLDNGGRLGALAFGFMVIDVLENVFKVFQPNV